tara:strand:- start:172 stop:354 length:183 start_codon:yes stop_codon:yes gene_type:complete
VISLNCNLKIVLILSFDMDLNEILTKERDSLRDENIELRKRINQLEISLQKALDMLENDD